MGDSQFPDAPAIVKDSLAKKHPQLLARARQIVHREYPELRSEFRQAPGARTARHYL